MGIRTPDLLIANETLYQLSYTPHDSSEIFECRFVRKLWRELPLCGFDPNRMRDIASEVFERTGRSLPFFRWEFKHLMKKNFFDCGEMARVAGGGFLFFRGGVEDRDFERKGS